MKSPTSKEGKTFTRPWFTQLSFSRPCDGVTQHIAPIYKRGRRKREGRKERIFTLNGFSSLYPWPGSEHHGEESSALLLTQASCRKLLHKGMLLWEASSLQMTQVSQHLFLLINRRRFGRPKSCFRRLFFFPFCSLPLCCRFCCFYRKKIPQ